ncbi:MAG TPA: phospholipase D-like domain-containing protein [Candidatus Angelobacter sp.]|nr:phospholipase D-like domain-containing protein [Candidatus Angelobacter sp.]
MSSVGQSRPEVDDVVLVFRPPENPAAQMAGVTPFKSLRLKLDELLDWFKDLNVDSIDLWIEGAFKSGTRTELFLSVEGKTGAKITLRPFLKNIQTVIPSAIIANPSTVDSLKGDSKETENQAAKPEKTAPRPSPPPITVLFSPAGGIERHVVSLIDSAVGSIEMAAYEFTNLYIEKALVEAVKRGVKVAMVLEKKETLGLQASFHDTLEKTGADIRLISPRGGKMNDKYIIVDGKTVEWGSYNYTESAEYKNFENAVFASDRTIAQQYHTDFASIFNQAKPERRGVKRTMLRFLRLFA